MYTILASLFIYYYDISCLPVRYRRIRSIVPLRLYGLHREKSFPHELLGTR